MARRSRSKSSNSNQLITYALIGVVVIVALVAGKSYLSKRAEHFPELSELLVSDLKTNSSSISGNEYKVSGKVSEKLKWTADKGQVISLAVEQTDGQSGIIPIIIPANVKKINIERGQKYIFKVDINREGLPIALDVKAL